MSRPLSFQDLVGPAVRGSALMIGMKWSMRLIGLVSTMILARLLMPEDFGVIAMATIFVGFIQLLSSTNFDLALIRIADAESSYYNTPWTLQLLLGTAITALTVTLAPAAASFFGDPRIESVAYWLALNALLSGCINIGLVDFRKNLEFHKDFKFNLAVRLFTFVVTMSLAFYLRTYWALVAGSLAGSVGSLTLSYIAHSYRPRFDLSRWREIVSFSQWMLAFHIGTYLRNRLDTLLVARIAPASAVGYYHVASELAAMPTNEVIVPTGRALFPTYAKARGELQTLRDMFRAALGFFMMFAWPAIAGVSVVADDLVRVILGAQWLDAIPLIPFLALAGGLNGISHVIGTFLAAVERQRLTAALTWINVVILVAALAAVSSRWDIVGIAAARGAVGIITLALALYFVVHSGYVNTKEILALAWRPMLSATAMALVVRKLHWESQAVPHVTLALDIITGVLSYAVLVCALWWISGKPPGTEALVTYYLPRRRVA